MGRHRRRFRDNKEFDIDVRKVGVDRHDVTAYEVVAGEPVNELTGLFGDEQDALQAMIKVLEKRFGKVPQVTCSWATHRNLRHYGWHKGLAEPENIGPFGGSLRLITQRSRVQIPPPQPSSSASREIIRVARPPLFVFHGNST